MRLSGHVSLVDGLDYFLSMSFVDANGLWIDPLHVRDVLREAGCFCSWCEGNPDSRGTLAQMTADDWLVRRGDLTSPLSFVVVSSAGGGLAYVPVELFAGRETQLQVALDQAIEVLAREAAAAEVCSAAHPRSFRFRARRDHWARGHAQAQLLIRQWLVGELV